MNYEPLFTPFKIGKMEVKNRLVMPPMGTFYAQPNGHYEENVIDYFERRAKGGVGMIIVTAMFINKKIAAGNFEGYLESDDVIPKLNDLVESIQRYGAKACAQLSAGVGRNAFPDMDGSPPYSASAIPSTFNPDLLCHALTKDEIKEIMNDYKDAARRLKQAGFDAIEIHGHAGYLIDQFMSPIWNKRTDEYGGTLEKRMRFAVEIVESIREVVGPDFPILFRISCDHRFEGGRTLEESMEILKILEKAGVDALDVDAGSYETIDYIFPPTYLGDACMNYVAKEARKAVSVPILNAGNYTPETALKALEDGDADFIMFGRQLIADPDFPNKLMNGRPEDIRPCIRCNEDCIGRILKYLRGTSCSVNTEVLREKRFVLEKTSSPKKVAVIGSGPAGLEAARAAAVKGHKVTLYEEKDIIGGQLAAAATPEFKEPLRKLIAWYDTQLKKLGVKIKLKTRITADSLELKRADVILVGLGASPVIPPIPGIDGINVIDVITAHLYPEKVGSKVIMAGGGLSGCDCALELAGDGKDVTIVEMLDEVAKDVNMINKMSLMNQLAAHKVKLLTGHKILAINETGITTETKDGTEEISGDTVIIAMGMRPNSSEAINIRDNYLLKTRMIGDCAEIGKVGTAIRSGYFAASAIE